MPRFLHAADIHLDSPLKGLEAYEDAPLGAIRGATRRAFDNLIDKAIEEEVCFLLLAGDLFDGDWKDYNTGLFFMDRMSRLRKHNIPVFIVSGNHDAASQITKAMPLPDNVTVFSTRQPETVRLDALGVAIHGQGYALRTENSNLAARFPLADPRYFNIGLLHTSLNGRPGHEPYAPCSFEDLRARGYDYWALGHVHQREIVAETPWVVFPGNLQGRCIRETGAKGASLVTFDEGRVREVEHCELDVLRWALVQTDLSDCAGAESVFARVRQAIGRRIDAAGDRPLALRLILGGACPIHNELHASTRKWNEELRGLAMGLGEVWVEKILFRTRPCLALDDIVGQDTPLAGLLRAMEGLALDRGRFLELLPEVETLQSRLPPELFMEDEPFLPEAPEFWEGLRQEVQELLIAKLLQHGDGS